MQLTKQWSWTIVAVGAFLLLLAIVMLMTNPLRLAKTLILIARVTPYEQVGTGSGTIQFLGDSTGYGTGASQAQYSVAGRLGADYPTYTINNQSVNGRTIAGLLADTTDFTGQFDLIVLQIGGNDILQKRDTAVVRDDLENLLQHLAPHAKEIVLLSAGNVGAAPAFSGPEAKQYEALSRDYRSAAKELAERTSHLTYIDLFAEPADDPFMKKPQFYHALDGLHPSDAGYELWYEQATEAFKAALDN